MTLLEHTHRQCSRCGEIKPVTEFFVNANTKMKKGSYYRAACKACHSKESWQNRKNLYYIDHMLYSAKHRAIKKDMDFNLTKEDIVIPEMCPLLNIPIIKGGGGNGSKSNSPSLDRIDNTKGYVKGNVWVISNKANAMKSNATPEELKLFVKNISKLFENYDPS